MMCDCLPCKAKDVIGQANFKTVMQTVHAACLNPHADSILAGSCELRCYKLDNFFAFNNELNLGPNYGRFVA